MFIPDIDCLSSEPYLITIGNHCQITSGVRLFTHGGGQVLRNRYPEFDTWEKCLIGNGVYIGNNSLIMLGVTIGDNVLIAAGSVITKSVPSRVVVVGNPTKIICTIDEHYQRNKLLNLDTTNLSQQEKKEYLISLPEDKFIKKSLLLR